MPTSREIGRAQLWWKASLLPIAFLITWPLTAQKAQKNNGPAYDLSTETKVKGTIEEVRLPPKGNSKDVAHLLLKSGSETFDVYLCPKAFLDDMGVSFSKGDEIGLTGSRVKQGEGEWILAREVVRGTDTLVLRDAKGNPVWS